MKAIKALIVAALAATTMAANVDVYAQEKHGFRGPGGGRHWGGHGGHWRGGHRGHWHGSFGLFLGAPLVLGAWGYPYSWYDDPFFYGPRVYREREVIREPVSEPVTTEIPRTEGAPTQGPMYMNYCESAKAYYPKVTRCPEGWKLTTPTQ